MVAKSFPWKQIHYKHFQHFLGQNFYCCKIISSETDYYQKFWTIFFCFQIFYGFKINSSKISYYQTFLTKCFGRKCFMVAKSFSRKQIHTITFQQNFLVETFLWLQNHFLENRFIPKIFNKCFFGYKIISSKNGCYQKVLTKFVRQKVFMVEKLFPW
jgi:hypothetical protein